MTKLLRCEKNKLVRCPRCRKAAPMKDFESVRIKGDDFVGITEYSKWDHNRVTHKGCTRPTRETAVSRVKSLFSFKPSAAKGIPIDQLTPEWEVYKIDNGAPSPITHIKCVNPNCPEKYVPRKDLVRPSKLKFWDKRVTCSGCNTKQYEPPAGSYSHPEYSGRKVQFRRGGSTFRPSGHKS